MYRTHLRTLLLLSASLLLPCIRATVWAKPYPICLNTAGWPISQCDANPTNSTFPYAQGFEPDVFAKAATLGLNWTLGIDYYFVCSSFSAMLGSQVGANNGLGGALSNTSSSQCFAGASGITITQTRIDNGIQFSFPHVYTSIAILVEIQVSTDKSIWRFFLPFTAQLWIAIACTGLIYPVLIMIVTTLYWYGSVGRVKPTVTGAWTFFSHLWYLSLAALMQPGPPDMCWAFEKKEAVDRRTGTLKSERKKLPPMPIFLMNLAFGFFTLIISATYLANLAAFLTADANSSQPFQSLTQLSGQTVGTSLVYAGGPESLAQFGVVPMGLQGSLLAGSLNSWLPMLRNETFAALMTDEVVIDQVYLNTSAFKSCDLTKLTTTVGVVNYGVAFHTNVPRTIIDGFNSGLVQMLDDGTLESLRTRWFKPLPDNCPQRTLLLTPAENIGLENMWGLWIIVAGAFGLSLLLSVLVCHVRRKRHHGGALIALFTQDELLLYGTHIESEAAEAITRSKSENTLGEKDKEILTALSMLGKSLYGVVSNVNNLSRSIHGSSIGEEDQR